MVVHGGDELKTRDLPTERWWGSASMTRRAERTCPWVSPRERVIRPWSKGFVLLSDSLPRVATRRSIGDLMPRPARFALLSLLIGVFSGTGCGPGGTNGTGASATATAETPVVGGACGVWKRFRNRRHDRLRQLRQLAHQDENETCDDGNKNPGDGCSATCQVEGNSDCAVIGQPCVSNPVCGDGALSRTEACDEGMTPTEGCTAMCKMVAPGWQCRVPGRPCVPLCGDGQLKGTENCDPPSPGMGCSTTCLTEPGWSCTGSPSDVRSVRVRQRRHRGRRVV